MQPFFCEQYTKPVIALATANVTRFFMARETRQPALWGPKPQLMGGTRVSGAQTVHGEVRPSAARDGAVRFVSQHFQPLGQVL